ncbi:MAG: gluconate 2-dehydrogenase subunit 3 family protein [Paraglaciecola sp.]|uniref:gluconate 2-dehydrogenase subunit 3 family protein n=1 Tax=Paraglaciecola sp. TaxID=1920173 RepID=UPI003297CCCC
MPTNSNNIELASQTIDEENRRLFMKKMVALFGATTASAVLSGCSVSATKQLATQTVSASKNGELLSEQQMTVLYSICETILPRTDTPSAVEVGCHKFVPHQLQHCHSQQQQNDCIQVINAIDRLAEETFSKTFPLLQPQQQQQILLQIENNQSATSIPKEHFKFLKALIVFGYFTSEAGATQALNFQTVPGGFVGSIPADANTKSWGSRAYY